MKTELDVKQKLLELKSTDPKLLLSLCKIDLPMETMTKIESSLPLVNVGLLIGLSWVLDYEPKELIELLFGNGNLPYNLKLEDFDIGR